MKLKRNIYLGLCMILPAVGFMSCNDDDITSDVTEIVYPKYVHMEVPEEWKGYVYTDATMTDVLPLLVGQTANLSYSLPDDATYRDVVWETSNAEVATVDENGKVTAVSSEGDGYSIVSVHPEVYYGGSTGLVGSLRVIVVDEINPVTNVDVTYDIRDAYYEGDILQMNYTFAPADATYHTVKWTSSDESLATVDAMGKVTLLKKGSVTITATSMDDNASKAVTFDIQSGISPTSISFADNMPKTGLAYGQKINLRQYVSMEPADAAFSMIEWKNNDGILSVDGNGVMTVLYTFDDTKLRMTGHTVTLEATDRNGNKLGEVELQIEQGFFMHLFKDGFAPFSMDWKQGTSWNVVDDKYVHMDLSTSGRQDIGIARNSTDGYLLNKNTYKYVAVKMRRPYYYDDENGYSNIQPDTPEGWRYNKLALNMNVKDKNLGHQNIKYWLDMSSESPLLNSTMKWDGKPLVYVWDLSEYDFGETAGNDPNGVVAFRNLDIVVADLTGVSEKTYDIYWVGTFSSLEAIKEFYESNE